MYAGTYTPVWECARSPELMLGVFLDHAPLYLLRQDLSLNLQFSRLASVANQLVLGFPVPASWMHQCYLIYLYLWICPIF